MTKNNKLRNDPAVRSEIKKHLEEKKTALNEANKLITEAERILRSVKHYNVNDVLYERSVSAVSRASTEVAIQVNMMQDTSTETYIGNLAVSDLGSIFKAEIDSKI
jgi:hypothetical protein